MNLRTKRVVFTSGVWDLLHEGHRNRLRGAKALGDTLVVGIVTDEFARSYKDPPVWDYERRFEEVVSLPYVDIAVPLGGFTDYWAIEEYGVSVRVIGPEYGRFTGQVEARAELERRGIKFVVLPRTPGISSTQLRKKTEV